MKNLFVPYDLALLAKEKGFIEECLQYYLINPDNKEHSNIPTRSTQTYAHNWNQYPSRVSAALYQQLICWFREKHKWHIYIRENLFEDGPEYRWAIRNIDHKIMSIGGNFRGYSSSKSRQTYQEAMNKAIEKTFELIKDGKIRK